MNTMGNILQENSRGLGLYNPGANDSSYNFSKLIQCIVFSMLLIMQMNTTLCNRSHSLKNETGLSMSAESTEMASMKRRH